MTFCKNNQAFGTTAKRKQFNNYFAVKISIFTVVNTKFESQQKNNPEK